MQARYRKVSGAVSKRTPTTAQRRTPRRAPSASSSTARRGYRSIKFGPSSPDERRDQKRPLDAPHTPSPKRQRSGITTFTPTSRKGKEPEEEGVEPEEDGVGPDEEEVDPNLKVEVDPNLKVENNENDGVISIRKPVHVYPEASLLSDPSVPLHVLRRWREGYGEPSPDNTHAVSDTKGKGKTRDHPGLPPLIERCRPHQSMHFVGHSWKLTKFRKWWKNPNRKPVMILIGPPGIGKTSMVTLVAKELGYYVREVNASDARSRRRIVDELREVACCRSLMGRPALLLDEFDGTTSAEGDEMGGNAVTGLLEFVHQRQKAGSRMAPIICIVNSISRSILALKKDTRVSECIYLNHLSEGELSKVANLVLQRFEIPYTRQSIRDAVASAGGDARKLLNHLEFYGNTSDVGGRVEKRVPMSAPPIRTGITNFDLADSLLYDRSLTTDDYMGVYSQDTHLFRGMFFENYADSVEEADDFKTLDTISAIADAFSLNDTVPWQISDGPLSLYAVATARSKMVKPESRRLRWPKMLSTGEARRITKIRSRAIVPEIGGMSFDEWHGRNSVLRATLTPQLRTPCAIPLKDPPTIPPSPPQPLAIYRAADLCEFYQLDLEDLQGIFKPSKLNPSYKRPVRNDAAVLKRWVAYEQVETGKTRIPKTRKGRRVTTLGSQDGTLGGRKRVLPKKEKAKVAPVRAKNNPRKKTNAKVAPVRVKKKE